MTRSKVASLTAGLILLATACSSSSGSSQTSGSAAGDPNTDKLAQILGIDGTVELQWRFATESGQ